MQKPFVSLIKYNDLVSMHLTNFPQNGVKNDEKNKVLLLVVCVCKFVTMFVTLFVRTLRENKVSS